MEPSNSSHRWDPAQGDFASTDEQPQVSEWVLNEAMAQGQADMAELASDTIPSPPPDAEIEVGSLTIPAPPPMGDLADLDE